MGKRAHYVIMPLHDQAHWSRYTRVIQGSNVTMAKVVVENGYRIEDVEDGPSFDGVGGDGHECGVNVDATLGDMELDGQLTQEQLYLSQMAVDESRRMLVGLINNDFDVDEFEQDEEKQAEEERIGDVVKSDLEDSDDEQGGRDAMPVPV